MNVHAAGQQAPVFRTHTELVRLDVTVTGEDGRPVDDVRPDEIQVTENGQPRPVILFRHLADRNENPDARPNLFNEVSENFLGAQGHLYLLVFDQLHIAVGGEQRVCDAVGRFLSRLSPDDAVAVYGLPGPGPVLDLTSDLIKVRGRLKEVHGKVPRAAATTHALNEDVPVPGMAASSEVVGAGIGSDPVSATEIARARASEADSRADTQTYIFLSQLAEAMRRLRYIEGRKSVVLFSEGFSVDNVGSQLEQVVAAAAQSESIVHVVDLSAGSSRLGTAVRRDGLMRLAAETNGRVLGDVATLDRTLSTIASESNNYYLIGFEAGDSPAAATYHPVKVKVTRRGLVAHARSGYASAPESTPMGDRQAIDIALAVPRTSSALPVEYTTYERYGASPDKPRIITSVTAYAPRALCDRTADVVFVVRDADTGQAVASGSDQVRLQASPGDDPAALQPVPYSVQFDVPPGEYWMRVLVREPGGVIGTADRRLHVWPLAGPGLATSDLIVTSLHGAHFDAPTQAEVHQQDEVLAYAEVYGSGDALQASNAKVEIGRADSGEILATVDPIVKSGNLGERILRARLPVAALAEGRYFARVSIILPNEAVKTVMRYFRVVPGR